MVLGVSAIESKDLHLPEAQSRWKNANRDSRVNILRSQLDEWVVVSMYSSISYQNFN